MLILAFLDRWHTIAKKKKILKNFKDKFQNHIHYNESQRVGMLSLPIEFRSGAKNTYIRENKLKIESLLRH